MFKIFAETVDYCLTGRVTLSLTCKLTDCLAAKSKMSKKKKKKKQKKKQKKKKKMMMMMVMTTTTTKMIVLLLMIPIMEVNNKS